MHPTVSKHYEEELASLALSGRAVEFETSYLFVCFFKESNPVPGTQQIIYLFLCVLFNYIISGYDLAK